MWTRSALKSDAKGKMKLYSGKAVVAAFIGSVFATGGLASGAASSGGSSADELAGLTVYEQIAVLIGLLVASAAVSLVTLIIKIFVSNIVTIGMKRFFVCCKTDEKPSLKEMLYGFRNCYGKNVKCMFLLDLFILLWSLLLVVPGIVKAYSWRMVPYIIAENPDITAGEARRMSSEMMNGNKWNAFVFDLSFVGWFLLSVVTCGFLYVLYVDPYYEMSCMELYYAVKENA